jgi:hypothetical protein
MHRGGYEYVAIRLGFNNPRCSSGFAASRVAMPEIAVANAAVRHRYDDRGDHLKRQGQTRLMPVRNGKSD